MIQIAEQKDRVLYEVPSTASGVQRYLLTTPETRRICNDPTVVGCAYTDSLRQALAHGLGLLPGGLADDQDRAAVLHVLRGGLNFGLREALGQAFGWNRHASAFISAQRARRSPDAADWYITESDYTKVYLPDRANVVFGDVVATGTSLAFALKRVLDCVEKQGTSVERLLFVCLGGARAEQILDQTHLRCQQQFESYKGASIVYLEGIFDVAEASTGLRVFEAGTDLLRRGVLTPEFTESQYESARYPLERCTIYDAGSRAFWLPAYFSDVIGYWHEVLRLAQAGVRFRQLLAERTPQLNPTRFPDLDLESLAREQVARLQA